MIHRYLNQEDVRDVRNLDHILSDPKSREVLLSGAPIARELVNDMWLFFRRLRVRLDKGGDKTVPFQRVKPMGRLRAKARKVLT